MNWAAIVTSLLYAALLAVFAAPGLGRWIKRLTGWQQGNAATVGCAAIFVIVGLFWVCFWLWQLLESWSRCPHGIWGGKTRWRCPQCTREAAIERQRASDLQEEEARRREITEKQEARKREIAEKTTRLRQSESERLYRDRLSDLKDLRTMNPLEFELTVCRMFERLGYRVQHTPFTNDGGKDALMWRNDVKSVLECKRYGEGNHVGRPELQKFFAAMKEERAAWGIFVTTSSFTESAAVYGQKVGIHLIDGTALVKTMRDAYPPSVSQYVLAVCQECGETVRFFDSAGTSSLRCSNGHLVQKPTICPYATENELGQHPAKRRRAHHARDRY